MTRKIHVLYITAQGNILGGGEVSLLNLLKYLNRVRFTPFMVFSSEGSFFEMAREMNLKTKLIALKPLRKLHLFSFIRGVARLFFFVRKEKIDIIHSNAAASRESIAGALAARLAGVPFIYHARVLESSKGIERFLGKLSKKIIATSEKVKEKFSFVKDKNKLVKILNAVDLSEFDPQTRGGEKAREEFQIDRAEKIIGAVGRLYPLKGLEVFLNAAYEVVKRISKTRFLIIGDDASSSGYKEKLVKQAEELGIKGKVLFTGFRQDIPELFSLMDIFVLPSLEGYEAFGRVVIEAMAMEKPVIATRSGGVPEIIDEGVTGILVPPANAGELAKSIVSLLENKEKAKKMGLQGRQKVERLYSLRDHLASMENLYLEILGGNKSQEKG